MPPKPQKQGANAPCFFDCLNLLPEVAVQQTLEGLAVASLVAGHLIVSPTGRPLRVLWEPRYQAVFQPRRRSS